MMPGSASRKLIRPSKVIFVAGDLRHALRLGAAVFQVHFAVSENGYRFYTADPAKWHFGHLPPQGRPNLRRINGLNSCRSPVASTRLDLLMAWTVPVPVL